MPNSCQVPPAPGATRNGAGGGGESRQGARVSQSRLWLMRLVAATLIPLCVLCGLELVLRLVGYGYPTACLLPSRVAGEDFLIPNYKFSYRFFPPALARKPALYRLATTKPTGTCRIFLFGESAAYGDPDPSYGVGRYLKALLEERHPSTEVEVIPMAMTAINSHALLPMARECARQEGDLWILYMGNNEMIGPYGAATVFGTRAPPVWLVRGVLAMKTLRVGQLFDAILGGLRKSSAVPRTWRGIDMFRENPLRHDDPARLRTYENFRKNLDDILRIGVETGIPVLVSTVASNLRDCSPFGSLHGADLDPAQLVEWEAFYEQGMAFQNAGSYEAALNAYSNAVAIDPEFAELQFRIGTCHLALTNREEALQAFQRARDDDVLAVRADTRINRILMDTAGQHEAGRVRALDAAQALDAASSTGISGQEWFYEHVHLTPQGNYQLARVMAEAVSAMLPSDLAEPAVHAWADQAECDRRLALTQFDRQRLRREMAQRISVAPFTLQSSHAANVRHAQASLQEILSQVTAESPKSDRVLYEEALTRAPNDNLLHANFAQFLDATGAKEEAILQGQRVCELLPDLSWPYYYVGALMMQAGRPAEAADYFERALEIRGDFPEARMALGRLRRSIP